MRNAQIFILSVLLAASFPTSSRIKCCPFHDLLYLKLDQTQRQIHGDAVPSNSTLTALMWMMKKRTEDRLALYRISGASCNKEENPNIFQSF